MFRCQECGNLSAPRKPLNKKVVETRNKTYEDGSKGIEIVREINVCEECK